MKIATIYVEELNRSTGICEATPVDFEEDTTIHSSSLCVSVGCYRICLGKIEALLISKVLKEWANS